MVNKNSRTVKSGKIMLRVIEGLQEMEGARVTELADHLGLANSTVHSHLATLEQKEFVVREGDKYQLSLKFLNIGKYTENRKPVYEKSKEIVNKLANKTGERAFFIIEEHGRGIVLRKTEGKNGVDVGPNVGQYVYLHTTSVGKAILSTMSKSKVKNIIDRHGLVEKTNQTITNKKEFFNQLKQVRNQGYAITDGERIKNLKSIGVCVKNTHGKPVGAISVSGPKQRINDKWSNKEIASLITGMAKELEMNSYNNP